MRANQRARHKATKVRNWSFAEQFCPLSPMPQRRGGSNGARQVAAHRQRWEDAAAIGEEAMLDRTILGLCLSAALVTALAAQDLPKTQIKVIGLNSPTPVSIYDEVPFWRKTIPEASKGAVTADITPLDQMGIDDKTMLRLLKLGVMDFAGMDISKMAGDDPRIETLPASRLIPTRRAPPAAPTVRLSTADAKELECQAPGLRRQHSASVLVS